MGATFITSIKMFILQFQELAGRAKIGKLQPQEYQGGSFRFVIDRVGIIIVAALNVHIFGVGNNETLPIKTQGILIFY